MAGDVEQQHQLQEEPVIHADAKLALDPAPLAAAAAGEAKSATPAASGSTPSDEQLAPFDPPFAPLTPPFVFWQDALLLTIVGGVMGLFGYGYLRAISKVTELWMSTDGNSGYPKAASSLQFGAGRWWWTLFVAGMGLAVGLVRVLLRLEKAPSFIEELRSMHCNPVVGFKSTLITLVSLLGGVPMGPEAGLGAAAGTLAVLLCRRRSFALQAELRSRLYALSAMCSAFSAFLPSPFVAVLMTLELGQPTNTLGLPHVHLALLLSFGATASFAAYYAISGYTYFSPIVLVKAVVSGAYDQIYLVQGILFGIMGAAFGMVYIVMAGVVKIAATAVRTRLDATIGRWPRVVVMATAGGAVVGAMGWAMPLVLTDGSAQLLTVMQDGDEVGSGVLAASAFVKALAYHVAGESGFSGGLFLPMLAMSSCLGRVFVNITGVNAAVALSCSSIALASSLIPAPFMLALMGNSLLLVGPEGLVSIFATAGTAHLLCTGVGFPQALLARSAASRKAKEEAKAATDAQHADAQQHL